MRPDELHGSLFRSLLALLVLATPGMGASSVTVQVPAETRQLTLEEAVQRALRHNPAYRRTTNSLGLNDIGHRQAWLDLLPQPSLTLLTTDLSWQRQAVAEDFFGNPLENPESRTVQTSRSRQGVSLAFQLDLANIVALREQGTQARIRDLAAVTDRRALAADVAQAFSKVRELELTLELEEALLVEAQRTLEAAQRLFTLSRRARTDVLGAELDLVERKNSVHRSRAELGLSRLVLRNLVGDPDLETFHVGAGDEEVFDPALLRGEVLLVLAVGESSRILEAEQRVMAAEHPVTRWRTEWLPRLYVGLNRYREEFLRDGSAFLSVNPDGGWGQTLTFHVAFPDPGLYFRRQNSAREARIELRNQKEALRETRLAVEEEVRRLLVELDNDYRSLVLQDRRAALAREELSRRLQSYRVGQVTFQDLQSATEAVAQARRRALEARFGFVRSRMELERVLGVPVGEAVGQPAGGPETRPSRELTP